MSIKVTITDPCRRVYEVEVPINAVAAIDPKTSYAETQQMIADYTAKTVSSVLGHHHDPASYTHHPLIEWPNQRRLGWSQSPDDPYIDQRTLDSCYVQRVGPKAQVGDDEVRVVVKKGNSKGTQYQYLLKRYAPLRRVLNAYTAEIGRDNAHFELVYKGDCICHADTADTLGIENGESLEAHLTLHDSMSPVGESNSIKEEVW